MCTYIHIYVYMYIVEKKRHMHINGYIKIYDVFFYSAKIRDKTQHEK